MKKKIWSYLLIVVMLISPFLSLKDVFKVKANQEVTITFNYQREDNNYTDWNLWVWEEGKDGSQYNFSETTDFGVSATLTFTTTSDTFGFIVRKGSWEAKDVDADRFVIVEDGRAEVWLKSGDPTIYQSNPGDATVEPVDPTPITGDVEINIYYHRFDQNYTDWNLWMWPQGKDGASYQFTQTTDFGRKATIKLDTQGATEVGFIVRKGEWVLKDVDADRFIQLSRVRNGVVDVYLVQGDARIYYRESDVDLSPKFLYAKLDGVNLISAAVSVPFDVINDRKEGFRIVSEGIEVPIRLFLFSEGSRPASSSIFQIVMDEDLDLSKRYTVERQGYGSIDLVFNKVFATTKFEDVYHYDGELGAIYTKDSTEFKLWAPTASEVKLNLFDAGNGGEAKESKSMSVNAQGVWSVSVSGDLHKTYYTYSVEVMGQSNEAVDPYARAVGVNGMRAMVVDLSSTNPDGWHDTQRPEFKTLTDAILYELHVRDLSISPDSGITHKGKFLGLTERGTSGPEGVKTGLDHMVELGVTHVHLLPAFDFRSIDETRLDANTFNWGYDPQHFNVPEGSYSTDPYLGEVRIKEFKQMVQALHQADIRVVMDVVYNHTGASADSDFSKIVPNYYYRMNDNGSFSNGSGTGNETASERSMMRKYMVDSVVYWATEYKVDGFRFDLMALHDIETMNAIRAALDEIDPSIIIYGEGWTGGASPLPDAQQALKKNTGFLDRIAAFSDDLRDGLKGHVFTDTDRGFVNGGLGLEETVKFGIVGNIMHSGVRYSEGKYSTTPWAKEPYHSISYVEAHDNLTLWDKLMATHPEAEESELITMHRMANAIVLTSQGIPFIHAGSEFLRTKDGDHNSYRSPDSVNQLVWQRKADYVDNVEYFKGLIELRKAHPAFRMDTADKIRTHLSFMEMPEKNMIGYVLSEYANGDDWKNIVVLANANEEAIEVNLEERGWVVVVNGEKAGVRSLDKISGSTIMVPAQTVMVLVDAKSMGGSNWMWYLAGLLILAAAGYIVHSKKDQLFTKKN